MQRFYALLSTPIPTPTTKNPFTNTCPAWPPLWAQTGRTWNKCRGFRDSLWSGRLALHGPSRCTGTLAEIMYTSLLFVARQSEDFSTILRLSIVKSVNLNTIEIHHYKVTFFPVSVWTSVGTISMKYWKFIKSEKGRVFSFTLEDLNPPPHVSIWLVMQMLCSLISVSFSSPSRGWMMPAWSSPKLSFSIL